MASSFTLSFSSICAAVVTLAPAGTSQITLDAQVQLNASDLDEGLRLGEAVAVGDRTFVAGGTGAYVYRLTQTGWQQSFDLNFGVRSSSFGEAVDLDGDTLVVTDRGAIDQDLGAAAYVFRRSGLSWDLEAQVPDGGIAPFYGFGSAVALSGDLLAVGAASDGETSKTGRVWIYARSGNTWSLDAVLRAGDAEAGDDFGSSLALVGSTLLVGAPGGDDAGDESGAAYVFRRLNPGTWVQSAKLVAPDAADGDEFGLDVSLSEDQQRALIGAPFDEDGGVRSGSAHVFEDSGTGFSAVAKLRPDVPRADGLFGRAVSVSGNRAVCASRDGLGGAGLVTTFTGGGSAWSSEAVFSSGNAAAGDDFGGDVDASQDLIVFGAPQDSSIETWAGAAYVFGPLGCIQPVDGFEPNDSCLAATPVGPGTFSDLTIRDGDDDWFSVTVPAGGMLQADVLFLNGNGNIDVELLPSCASPTDSIGNTFTDDESLFFSNAGVPIDVDVKVRVFLADGAGCNEYELQLTLMTPPVCLGIDDPFEDNDSCDVATTLPAGNQIGLVVSDSDPDFFRFLVPPGTDLELTAAFLNALGDVNLTLFSADCSQVLDLSQTADDVEVVSVMNPTGGPLEVVLRVTLASPGCNVYDLFPSFQPTASPCAGVPDDSFEENDDCANPASILPGLAPGLTVFDVDEDYYVVNVPPGLQLVADALFQHAGGDIDVELYDPGCGVLLDGSFSVSDDETVVFANNSGAPADVVLRVYLFSGACNGYDLNLQLQPIAIPCTGPDDALEDNDTCQMAVPLGATTSPGLFVSKTDEDWYEITVPPGQQVLVDALFLHVNGDVDLELYTDCLLPPIAISNSISDFESVSFFNVGLNPQVVFLRVLVWSGSAQDCNVYDLNVTLALPGGANLAAYCFGNGTACPCGNNADRGVGTGCVNSSGVGVSLAGTGNPSLAGDSLRFVATGGVPFSAALLVSGDNLLPLANPGQGVSAFDGLRCVGGNLQRHGSRTSDANGDWGLGSPGWGTPDPPSGGLLAQGGFQAGATRYFQIFYREAPGKGCGSGQNSSNAVQVFVLP